MDKRPYRPAVRVIVVKDGKVLMGKHIVNGKTIGYKFPGGGVEKGETLEQATVKEVLEEVGIACHNVIDLGLFYSYDVAYKDPERAKQYRGGVDNWMLCRYISMDRTLLGTQGDSFPFTWESFEGARSILRHYHKDRFNDITLKALQRAEDILRNNKPLLKTW